MEINKNIEAYKTDIIKISYESYTKELAYLKYIPVKTFENFEQYMNEKMENIKGLVYLEEGKCTAYLLYHEWEENAELHCSIPEYGYGSVSKNREKTISYLFQTLAEDIVSGKTVNFSVHLYAHGQHRFNIKYELADYFIKRALEEGINLSVLTNLFAYDCPNPTAPDKTAEGEIYKCEMKDKEELARFVEMFHEETGVGQMDWQGYLDYAEFKINEGRTFLWKDVKGNPVSSCGYQNKGELASIGMVFTRPEHRRKHYAENLVYKVSKMAEEEGSLPMLYTDADYVASNACYEKIGYILRGKLCTVG